MRHKTKVSGLGIKRKYLKKNAILLRKNVYALEWLRMRAASRSGNMIKHDAPKITPHITLESYLRTGACWLTVVMTLWSLSYYYAYGTKEGSAWILEDLTVSVSINEILLPCASSF